MEVTKENILSELFVPEYMSKVGRLALANNPLVNNSNRFIEVVCTLSVKELEDHNESFRDDAIAGISSHSLKTDGQFWRYLWDTCFQNSDTTLENAFKLASWLRHTEAQIRGNDEYWLVPERRYITEVFTEYGAFRSFVARKLEPVQRIEAVINSIERERDWRILNLVATVMEAHALWGIDDGHEIDRYIKFAGEIFIQSDLFDDGSSATTIDDSRLFLKNTLLFARSQMQRLEPVH